MPNKSCTRVALLLASAVALSSCSQIAEVTKQITGGGDAPSQAPAATKADAVDSTAAAQAAQTAQEKDGLEAGVEAVVYGLPLVLMDATRQKLTNVAAPAAFAAPVNQFAHVPQFPDASFKDVVRANVDTLYSEAWLELSKEPMVLSLPDTRGRYVLMPMLDAWTNIFASPGKRTTGTRAGHFAITGPGWTGKLPPGVRALKAPTNMVWIIGRTQTHGPKDYAAVRALQRQVRLTPLSAFGKPSKPPAGTVDASIDMRRAPVEVVGAMGTAAFLNRMAALMRDNPSPADDAPTLAKLGRLGVVPGQPFDPGKLDPAFAKGLERALPIALDRLTQAAKATGAAQNGWRIPSMKLADFGTDHATRAVIALVGLGANLAADAVYPSAYVDADGQPLNGAHRYLLRFEKGQEPPVRAFWSVTMYDPDSFFVANPLKRYALSSWMSLKRNRDGSLDLYIQKDSPGKALESNWLPAPAGDFNLTLRMYWPSDKSPSVLDGSWKPPRVRRVP